MTFVGSTDSAILGALPTAGAYGAANSLNQVASVPAGGGLLRWSAAGMLESDGLCRDYTHDARGRLIQALRTCTGTGLTFTQVDFAYGPDNLRVETARKGSAASGVTGQLTDMQRIKSPGFV